MLKDGTLNKEDGHVHGWYPTECQEMKILSDSTLQWRLSAIYNVWVISTAAMRCDRTSARGPQSSATQYRACVCKDSCDNHKLSPQ